MKPSTLGRLKFPFLCQSTYKPASKKGLIPLKLRAKRDGIFYVPNSYGPNRPAPILFMFHGSGSNAQELLKIFQPLSERFGVIIVAPESTDKSWDHNFERDHELVEKAIERLVHEYWVDEKQFAIAGFSDGASYALSLGLANNLLFTHIMAFSPGFLSHKVIQDPSQIFIAHGVYDEVLPIQACSRRIAPMLESLGHQVTYEEFEGQHSLPHDVADNAMHWFIKNQHR